MQSFVVYLKLKGDELITTIAQSKKALTTLLQSLKLEDSVIKIIPIVDYHKFGEVMQDIRKRNKPADLNYGQKEGEKSC